MINKYLKEENIFVNVLASDKSEVFKLVYENLSKQGSVDDGYHQSMIDRDKLTSVAIGNYIAIAHGMVEAKNLIKKNGICILVLKNPIQWDNQEVKVILGLAFVGDETLDVIGSIGVAFGDEDEVKSFFYQDKLTPKQVLDWMIAANE
ncbi:PTS sugar transporter subunit IIA [[Mycoplasma] imitans]|uniref:PTS sugar transporter subunit IIA n=1 Tax=[Mycoplasma] imitans TaxID=29560 RepID=UPI0004B62C6F|nr:PTS sugar transporter subunit IIA [[Mycoplasma] imitans]